MQKKMVCFLLSLVALIAIAQSIHAKEQTVFGPDDFKLSAWRMHLSRHTFNVDVPDDGYIAISKNTPEKDIKGGFVIFNWRVIPLKTFLRGNDLDYFKDIKLKAKNRLTVLLRGTPGASLKIEIKAKDNPIPPLEITFSADPGSIVSGESTTLSWEVANADTITIDNGIGIVSATGSMVISPLETTTYTIAAIGPGGTAADSATVSVSSAPPTVGMDADPETIVLEESTTLSWTSSYADSATIDHGIGSVPVDGSITVSPTETMTYTITVAGTGGTTTDSVTVNVTNPSAPPTVSFSASSSTIPQGGISTLSWSSSGTDTAYIEPDIGSVELSGSVAVSPVHTTTYTITVKGSSGVSSASVTVKVLGSPETQPEGSFGEDYQDLIPEDATIESYDTKRFALITGSVTNIDETPLAGVSITILNHPEYGTVVSGDDGGFAIPVEGGASFVTSYIKEGYISIQRKTYVPWNDYAVIDPARMIAEDTAATQITLDGNSESIFIHRSSPVTDDSGTRSATVMIKGDNQVFLTDKDGNNVMELETFNLRVTEYSTPESMPAVLPPTSAFTYCAEFSVDGAERVKFANPVTVYVDNFIGFNVGEIIPVGYYNRDTGLWVPSDNGRVVKLLDTDSDGVADALDMDGDNSPDDIDGDGSVVDEISGLTDSDNYSPGDTLWRFETDHFSPWDCNDPFYWPAGGHCPPAGPTHCGYRKNQQQGCSIMHKFIC